MKTRTQIKSPSYPFSIHYADNMLSLGSCFSTNIAQKLSTLKYKIIQNPSGITFNPASILSTTKSIIKPDSLLEEDLVLHNGLWSHPDFHGSFNHPDRPTAYSQALASLKSAHEALPHCSIVFLTLGTSIVFSDKETGHIVNNCHKRPATHFNKEILSVDTIVNLLNEALDLLQNYNGMEVKFVLTVSPVRHIKNGLIEDKLSKSRCLLAAHEVVSSREDAHYFPSYEIMMDDLRDYRYYADDLIHPSEMAIDYIFEQFAQALLSKEEETLRQRVKSITTRQNHRPLFPDTEAHQVFLSTLNKDINDLQSANPTIRF